MQIQYQHNFVLFSDLLDNVVLEFGQLEDTDGQVQRLTELRHFYYIWEKCKFCVIRSSGKIKR